MQRVLERGVMDATVVELVLAVATAFALNHTLQGVGWRIFADQEMAMAISWVQILAPLFAFVILAILLVGVVRMRLRAEDELLADEASTRGE